MYWDDWNRKAIFFANKNSGNGTTELLGQMNGAMDLKIFSSIHRSGTNACSKKPCSHLCVPMPSDRGNGESTENYQCRCPDGKQLLLLELITE